MSCWRMCYYLPCSLKHVLLMALRAVWGIIACPGSILFLAVLSYQTHITYFAMASSKAVTPSHQCLPCLLQVLHSLIRQIWKILFRFTRSGFFFWIMRVLQCVREIVATPMKSSRWFSKALKKTQPTSTQCIIKWKATAVKKNGTVGRTCAVVTGPVVKAAFQCVLLQHSLNWENRCKVHERT